MNNEAIAQLAAMLNGFPQGSANPELTMKAFKQDLAGFRDQIICEVARRFRCNEIPDQSTKFAPSSAAFVKACREHQEAIDARERLKEQRALPRPDYAGAPFEIALEKARQKFAGRPVLGKCFSDGEFKAKCGAGEFPVGAVWSAKLGTVFGE